MYLQSTINDLDLWLEAFDDYVTISQPKAVGNDKLLRSLLLATAGMEMRKIVAGLSLQDDTFKTLISAVRKYFQPVKNVI